MAGAGDGKTRRLGLTEPYNHAQTASGKLRVKQGAWLGEAISLRIEGWAGGGGGRLKREGPCAHLQLSHAAEQQKLTRKIPWMEEPRRLQSMGLLKVGHD